MATRESLPLFLLEAPPLSRGQMLGGIGAVVLAHVGVPLAFMVGAALFGGADVEAPRRYIDEDHVVEARFVRKGIKKDPDKLPDRVVPRKATAPDDSTVVSKDMNPEKPNKPDAGPPPEKAEEDLVKRLGDRVQAFSEISDRELEGDPDGIEDGTETEAQAGDIYRGKLVEFFRRGWTIPTTLGDTSKLTVTTVFLITPALKVGPSEIVKPSGEAMFDQSVEDRFEQLRTLGTTLPEPPPEIADQFVGQEITVRFRGERP
jgi:hypothetical protein